MEESELLLKRRKRLYFFLLIFQVITYVVQLVFVEIYWQNLYPISEITIIILQVTAGICLNIASVMFLRLFIKRNSLFFAVVAIVLLSFFLQTGAATLTSSANYTGFSLYRFVQITIAIL